MIKLFDYVNHNIIEYYKIITIKLAAKAYSHMASSDA